MALLSIVVLFRDGDCEADALVSSILNQSVSDVELILADCTKEGCALPKWEDSRVKILDARGKCPAEAKNLAMKEASGTYLHFADSTDRINGYGYESVLAKAVKKDADCIKFVGFLLPDGAEQPLYDRRMGMTGLNEGLFNRNLSLSERIHADLCMEAWSGLYKKTFLEENKITFPDLTDFEDRLFSVSVMLRAERYLLSKDRVVFKKPEEKEAHDEVFFRSFQEAIDEMDQFLTGEGIDKNLYYALLDAEIQNLLEQASSLAEIQNAGEVLDALIENAGFLLDWKKKLYKKEKLLLESGEANGEKKNVNLFFERCEEPAVSVLVPVYNQEEFLNLALESLSSQTLKNIEFLCVNDGSKDSSLAILKQYREMDRRIEIIDKENTGYGNTMNVALDAARGKYIGILEPDDFVPKDMFKRLYKVAEEHDLDLVKADFYRFEVNPDGSLNQRLARLSGERSYYNRAIEPAKEQEVFFFIMNTWSGIYRRSFLNEWNIRHNETPGASYQDNGFWFQTFMRAKRAWFLDEPFYMNRRDNPNSSIYDKGKTYMVTEEYRHIRDIIRKEPELERTFEKVFETVRLRQFKLTYARLARELKREYLHHIKDEFEKPLKEGKILKDYLIPYEWNLVNGAVEDPDAYENVIRVSVIIPAYNCEAFIGQCLTSLVVRNEIHSEIIVVDDGSTDRTAEIVQEFTKKYPEVRLIRQENQGAGAARNAGMKEAKGEFLAFYDADDFFDPSVLRLAYERASAMDCDVFIYGSDQYFEKTDSFAPMKGTMRRDLLPREMPFAGTDVKANLFKAFKGWPWDKLFKRSFVEENGLRFQELRTTNDLLFVCSALAKAERISLYGRILAHHRRLEANESLSVSREKSWDNFYKALLALRAQLEKWNLLSRFEKDFVNYSLQLSLWNLHTLKGKAYHELYQKLKEEWFENLGVLSCSEKSFYNRSEYEKLEKILEMDSDEYLHEQIDALSEQQRLSGEKLDETKRKLTENRQKLSDSKERLAISKEQHSATKEKLEVTKEKLADSKQKLSESKVQWKEEKKQLKSELKDSRKQCEKAQKELTEIKESRAYQTGLKLRKAAHPFSK